MPSPITRGKYCRYNPSYPFLPTLAVYILWASSSLVVISIVSYFVFHLRSRHLFFHLLSAASYFVVLQLLSVLIISYCYSIPVITRLVTDAISCGLWAAGFTTMAAYDVRQKLLVQCTGHLICSLYKVLFAFAAVGLIASILALALDVYVLRRVRSGYENIESQANREQDFLQPYRPSHLMVHRG